MADRCWLPGLLAWVGLSLTAQAQVTVTGLQPARQAVTVARTAGVNVGFSQPIAPATATNMRVYGSLLQGKRGGSVLGGGSTTLTFRPSQVFAPGEVVSVSLPPTMTSPGGTMVTRQVYQFTAATGGSGRGFFLDTTRVGNTTSRDQVLGDLDNDGDLDLITTGALFGCRVFLNDGTGRYSFKTGFLTGEEPAGATLADVNQDGYLDVLVGDSRNATVAVRINDGTGDFATPLLGYQNAPVGTGSVSVAAGDLDGDGDLDFATANLTAGSASVWLNDGSPATTGFYFNTVRTVSVGTAPMAVALADIDNDGDLDLLTSNAGPPGSSGEVHVSRNSGTGTFAAYTTVAVGLRPTELVLADVDGDGDLDLLTANAGAASVSMRLNGGSGTFSGTTTLALPLGSTPSGLRTGDVDGDGDLDLVVAQGTGSRVFTFINRAGTFAVQSRALRLSRLATANAIGVTLGDVDGDLDLDLLTSDENGNVLLSRNVGPPLPLPSPVISSLTPAAGPVGTSTKISGTALTDITGVFFNGVTAPGFVLDGSGTGLTVAVPVGASSGLVTITTEEAGTATSPNPFTVTVPVPVLVTKVTPPRNAPAAPRGTIVTAAFTAPITAATAGNLRLFSSQQRGRRSGALTGSGTSLLTFDPDQDFAPGEQVSISLPSSLRAADGNQAIPQVIQFTAAVGGTGQANFTTETKLAVSSPGKPVVVDSDNDGDLDVLLPTSNRTVSTLLNDGSGSLRSGPDLSIGSSFDDFQAADVDGDGDLDLVVRVGAGTVSIWLNKGDGTFSKGSAISTTGSIQRVVVGDVDADGDLDMVWQASSDIRVRLNDGTGVFTGSYSFTLPNYLQPKGIALGDVDGDGDLDVLAGGAVSYGDYVIYVQLNDGNGQFGAGQSVALIALPEHIVIGDVDGDGDLDLVVKSTLNAVARMTVRLNDGTGIFGGVGDLPMGGTDHLLADVDGDGDLDIVTDKSVGLNNGAGSFTAVLPTGGAADYPAGIALGDLDGDGDLDLITSQSGSSTSGGNTVSLRFNQPRPLPTITRLTPPSGPVGTHVLVTGTQFVGAKSVAFNGVAATSYTVNSATEMVATVPTGATSGPVTVTTPAGVATSATPFDVTLPIAVVTTQPARQAASVPGSTAVSVTFTQPISRASATGLRVVGSRLHGNRPGALTGGGTATLTFTPAQAFAPGETVSVSLPASLTGTSGGNVLRQVFQFTAAASGTGTGLFMATGTADVPIDYRSSGLAVGDVDNDNDLDLVTTDGSIRLNTGAGAFVASPTKVSLGQDPLAIALGDLNNDGALDLVTTNGQVRLNTGTGSFTELPSFSQPSFNVRAIALGDLDGDGDLDLVTPDYATDSLYVRFNDGTGRFPAKQLISVGNRPVGVAIGDVDNDGDLDVIASSEGFGSNASTLSICFNNGIGLFDRVGSVLAGSYARAVVLGDLDGDGDLDLVTDNGYVRLNDGTGAFSGTQTTTAAYYLALADVDADGDLDLLTTKGSGTSADMRLNDGYGVFGMGAALDFGNTWGNLTLADVDGDGDLDALGTDRTDRIIHLRLNQRVAPPAILSFSPGSALPGASVVVTGTDFIGATAVAFNGTLAPDFLVTSATQLTVRVPAGATTGLITITNPKGVARSAQPFLVLLPVPVLSSSPLRNAVAPLTAPVTVNFGRALATNSTANLAVFSQQRGGRLAGTRPGAGSNALTLAPAQPFQPGEQLSVSIPEYTEANQLRVVKQVYQFRAATGGTGRGFFTEPTTYPLNVSTGSLLVGDVDNDGDQDVLSGQNATVVVQYNNGAGVFGGSTSVPVAVNPGSMVLGDVDGDGDLDLAVVSLSGKTVSLRLNNGRGEFAGTTEITVGDKPQAVALADMDADGDLDLVTVNGTSAAATVTTSVRFNDGAGNFAGSANELINELPYYGMSNLEIGDVDSDGDLDLAIIVAGNVHVCRNDGNGRLRETSASFSTPYNGGAVLSLSDVDADFDLDLLLISASNISGTLSQVSVLLNDGTGTFAGTTFLTLPNAVGMAVGDVDADGDPDVLISNHWDTTGQVWLNNGRGTFARQLDLSLGLTATRPLLSDIDGDGDLDLLHTNSDGVSLKLSVRFNGPPPPPVVTSFAPASGPEGTLVVLTGSGFTGTTAVRFNGTNAPGFVLNSPTQISVRVPTGATTGRLTVVTPVATATSSTPFTVIPLVRATAVEPRANATAAARNAMLNLTFASAVTASTAGNMRVFGNQLRGRRTGTLTGGGTTRLSFDPDQDFAPGEQVSISLPSTMQTADGGLVKRQVYQFTAATGGAGRGLFKPSATLTAGWYANDLKMGDIDNDGDIDILTLVQDQTGLGIVTMQLNDGRGRFVAGSSLNSGGFLSLSSRLVLGDVDSDGDLDVVVSYGGYAVSLSLNQGNGTFAPYRKYTNLPCDNLELGDVDADGDLDLVLLTYQSGTLRVALNNGLGDFQLFSFTADAPKALAMRLGDVDGDGDLDAVTINDTVPRLYLNDGTGVFDDGTALPATDDARDVALGDVDSDGDLDVVLSSNDINKNGQLTVLRNKGNGSFTDSGLRVALGTYTNRMQLGDVDSDGDLDAVAANGSSNDVTVRLNNGQGSFFGTPSVSVSANPYALALGDLDGDGDLDLVAMQSATGGALLSVRLNDGQPLASIPAQSSTISLQLYPNPAHGQFSVVVPTALRTAVQGAGPFQLYNALGQKVVEQPFHLSASGELVVHVAHLPAGIYTLRIPLAQGLSTHKISIF